MRLAILVVISTLLAVPALAVYVPSDGATVTVPAATGWYSLHASGTWFFDYPREPNFYCDAEWVHGYTTWTEIGANHFYQISVNGIFPEWKAELLDGTYEAHTYSPTHIYKTTLWAESGLRLSIWDSDYSDNVGGLDVTIEPVPEPSSLLALGAGIATLTTLKRRRKG